MRDFDEANEIDPRITAVRKSFNPIGRVRGNRTAARRFAIDYSRFDRSRYSR